MYLEFKGVTKEYEDKAAVRDINFGIEKGEFVFLVGASGAGKTTLIKMLTREELPTQGEIIFDEINVLEIPQENIHELRRKIGVVFQDFKIMGSRTVSENVAVALEVVESDAHVTSEVVPNVLNLVGLQDKADAFPKQLSGGEKQRLAIARALAHEPDILVADEPTGMIDPDAADEVMKVLEKINSLGTTILMATHNQSIVDKFKKRVIRIEDGEIKSDKEEAKYHD
jgi:cell division transport system ATP-binding protein